MMSLSVCRWQASIFSPGKPVFPSLSTSKVVTFRMSLSCALPTLQKTVCNYKCTGSWGFLPDHVVLCQVGGITARRFHRFYYWLYCNWSCACLGCESLSTCLWVSQKKNNWSMYYWIGEYMEGRRVWGILLCHLANVFPLVSTCFNCIFWFPFSSLTHTW